MQSILKPVVSLQDQPEFVESFARIVSESVGMVCGVCGLERMGHAPESSWLGYERHPWSGVEADSAMLERAGALTVEAYRRRSQH